LQEIHFFYSWFDRSWYIGKVKYFFNGWLRSVISPAILNIQYVNILQRGGYYSRLNINLFEIQFAVATKFGFELCNFKSMADSVQLNFIYFYFCI